MAQYDLSQYVPDEIPVSEEDIKGFKNYLKKYSGATGNLQDAKEYSDWSNEHPYQDLVYGGLANVGGYLINPIIGSVVGGIDGFSEGLANTKATRGTNNLTAKDYILPTIQGVVSALPGGKISSKAFTTPIVRRGLFNTRRVSPAVLPQSTRKPLEIATDTGEHTLSDLVFNEVNY